MVLLFFQRNGGYISKDDGGDFIDDRSDLMIDYEDAGICRDLDTMKEVWTALGGYIPDTSHGGATPLNRWVPR